MGKSRVKGIVVQIGGDTVGLDKALQGTNKQIRNTQSQLKDVERLLKLDPKNTVLLEQKQKLLAKTIQETKTKQEALNQAHDQVKASMKNYDQWKAAYDPIKSQIDDTAQKLKDLKAQQKDLEDCGEIDTDAYKQLTEEVQNTSQKLRDLKKKAKEVNDQFDNPASPEQFDALQREIIETEQLLKALEDKSQHVDQSFTVELASVQRELREVNSLLYQDSSNTTLLEQKQELLTDAIDLTRKSIQSMEDDYNGMLSEAQYGVPKNAEAFRKLERQIEAAKLELQKLSDEALETDKALAGIDDTAITVVKDSLEIATEKCYALEKELDTVNEALELDPDSIKLLTLKQDVLSDSIEATTDKLKQLEERQRDLTRQYASGDIDRGAYLDLQEQIARTKKKLEDLESAAEDNFRDISDATGPVKSNIREIGDAAEDAKTKVSGFGDLLKSELIVEGAERIADAIKDTVENTKDYRKIMGSLEVSSEAAAYSGEQTYAAYKKLQGVLADEQSAATTVANLQALRLGQDELLGLIDAVIGGWARYGDSIPIDGLAEAINETVKTGKVTGALTDILNWGAAEGEDYGQKLIDLTKLQEAYDAAVEKGEPIERNQIRLFQQMTGIGNVWDESVEKMEESQEKELAKLKAIIEAIEEWNAMVSGATTAADKFDIALQQQATEEERLLLVMQTLRDQGLPAAAEKWRENNASMVEANETSADLQEQLAELAEIVEPLMTQVTAAVVDFLKWFNGLDGETQNFIIKTVALVAALGPVIGAIAGTSVVTRLLSKTDFPGLGSALEKISGVHLPGLQGAFSSVFGFIAAHPVVLLIGAIAGLVAFVATNSDKCMEILNGFDEFLQVGFATDWTEVFGPVLGGALNDFFAVCKEVWDGVKKMLEGIIDFIAGLFSLDWERAWEGVKKIFTGIFDSLEGLLKAPINAVIRMINKAIDGINWLIEGVNHIPGVTLGTIGQIPLLANGGEVFRGSAIVGEAGPELMTVLQDRTVVQPLTNNYHNATRNMGGTIVNVYGAPGQDVHELAEAVAEEMQYLYESEEAAIH